MKKVESVLMTTVGDGAAHQTVFTVACNSDSETLAALQTVETTVLYFVPKDNSSNRNKERKHSRILHIIVVL